MGEAAWGVEEDDGGEEEDAALRESDALAVLRSVHLRAELRRRIRIGGAGQLVEVLLGAFRRAALPRMTNCVPA